MLYIYVWCCIINEKLMSSQITLFQLHVLAYTQIKFSDTLFFNFLGRYAFVFKTFFQELMYCQ